MIATCLLTATLASAQAAPAIEASSVYGMRTYTTNPEFGFLPDKIAVAFPPADIGNLTMRVLRGDAALLGGGFYATETPYPSFQMLRFQPQPTINLAEAGDYVLEFRNGETPASRFPFTIRKKLAGDEFNPTVSWDFITPVDRMGTLSYSSANDTHVWMAAWIAPGREGIAMRSTAQIRLTHGGKVVAHALPYMFQEPQNARFGFKLMKPEGQGRAPFNKSDLLKLSGDVKGVIEIGGKAIRTFTWNISGGAIKAHTRSASGFEPRTNYLVPRRLAGSEAGYQFFHLEEQYWAESQ